MTVATVRIRSEELSQTIGEEAGIGLAVVDYIYLMNIIKHY